MRINIRIWANDMVVCWFLETQNEGRNICMCMFVHVLAGVNCSTRGKQAETRRSHIPHISRNMSRVNVEVANASIDRNSVRAAIAYFT